MQSIQSASIAFIYLLIYGLLRGAVVFAAPSESLENLFFAGLGGIFLVLAGYGYPARFYRTLLVAYLFTIFGAPLIFNTELIRDWWLSSVYLFGIVFAVEVSGYFNRRQQLLLMRSLKAEQEASASQQLLQRILETSPNQIVLKDRDKRFTYVNRAFLESTGWREADILGKRDSELLSAADAARYEEIDEFVLTEGRPHPDALDWVEQVGGELRWYKLTKLPILARDGKVEGVLAISSDITELKNTQDALNRHIHSVQTLAEVSTLLLAATSYEAGLERVLPLVGDTLNAAELCVFVHEHGTGLDGSRFEPGTPASSFEGQFADIALRFNWIAAGTDSSVPRADETASETGQPAVARQEAFPGAVPPDTGLEHRVEPVPRGDAPAGERLEAAYRSVVTEHMTALAAGKIVQVPLPNKHQSIMTGTQGDAAGDADEHGEAEPQNAEAEPQNAEDPARSPATVNLGSCFVAPIFVNEMLWGGLVCAFLDADHKRRQGESLLSALAANIGVAVARFEAQRVGVRERNLLRAIIDNAPDFVYIKDVNLRYVVANRAFVRVMGFGNEAELAGKTDSDIHTADVAKTIYHMDMPIIHGEMETFSIQEEVILPETGEHRWMLTTKAPVQNNEGEVVGLITISRDVTEMKAVENRLRVAKEEAEAATRAKSEFLANMSHEIRTPLNGVIGMTSLLLSSSLADEQREFVETIRTSSDDLLLILNDILDYSKIESGKLTLEDEVFDPLLAVEDVVELQAGRRHDDRLTLCIIVAPQVPMRLRGDVTRFRQIVGNLVSNAVKFTPAGQVVVRLGGGVTDDAGFRLEVSVTDTGIGIPEGQISRLFHSFSQGDGSTTRRFGGTGLGLAISKQLVEMMDGQISVSSEEGTGSEFRFWVRLGLLTTPEGESDRTALPNIQKALFDGIAADPSGLELPALDVAALLSQEGMAVGAKSGDGQVRMNRIRPDAQTFAGWQFYVADPNPFSCAALCAQLETWGGTAVSLDGPGRLQELSAGAPERSMLLVDEKWAASVANGSGTAGGAWAAIICLMQPHRISQAARGATDTSQPEEASSHLEEGMLVRPVRPTALATLLQALVFSQSRQSTRYRASLPLPPQLASEMPARILLVEDNLVNQRVAMRMLERLGYGAALANNGQEALDALDQSHYDVVFMDIHMPELDGHAATQFIRRHLPASRQPYIIAMTADAMPGYREKCLAAGMDDYVAKPIRLEDITAALRRYQQHTDAGYPHVDSDGHSPAAD